VEVPGVVTALEGPGAARRAEEDTVAVARVPTARRDDGGDDDAPAAAAYDVGIRTRAGPGSDPAGCSSPSPVQRQPAMSRLRWRERSGRREA
jgi:hypothetical protein